jgi:hypothetical protein
MAQYNMSSGIEAVDALQKLWEASPTFNSQKFTETFRKIINELDDRRTNIVQLIYSTKVDDENKRKLTIEMNEIQMTFTELKRLSETIYELMRNTPGKLPKPIENAWSIFSHCIYGKDKKETLSFILGFRAGTVFSLKYGNVWRN